MQQQDIDGLELTIKQSNTPISKFNKSRVYMIISELRDIIENPFGIIAVLGATNFNDYTAPMDKDFFKNNPVDIYQGGVENLIAQTVHYDGAIMISPDGKITHSGVYLAYQDFRDVLKAINAPADGSLPERFGFAEDVGTRHISAICFSYRMPKTTVYIVSEETGKVRIFENGRIVYSPLKEEVYRPKKEAKSPSFGENWI